MRRALPVFMLTSFLAGFTGLRMLPHSALLTNPDDARLKLDFTEIRISNVRRGEPVRTAFPVRNVGSRRLVIVARDQSCCGDETNRVVVEPGQSAMLQLKLDTGSLEEARPYHYRFSANDPDMPVFRLTLIVEFNSEIPAGEFEPLPVED